METKNDPDTMIAQLEKTIDACRKELAIMANRNGEVARTSYNLGYEEGLKYAQARIDELKARVEKLEAEIRYLT